MLIMPTYSLPRAGIAVTLLPYFNVSLWELPGRRPGKLAERQLSDCPTGRSQHQVAFNT
jgi:hypothetical protein